MHLEGDKKNVFEYALHSNANFNSRAVHLFGALESFCSDFSNRSCLSRGSTNHPADGWHKLRERQRFSPKTKIQFQQDSNAFVQ